MERLIILSGHEDCDPGDSIAKKQQLKPSEIGEIVLNVHRYLLLVESTGPSFPRANSDHQIHAHLQDLLGTKNLMMRLAGYEPTVALVECHHHSEQPRVAKAHLEKN
jgi:hypothetical protein